VPVLLADKVDKELKVNRIDRTRNYNPSLSKSQSQFVVVMPRDDNHDLDKSNNINFGRHKMDLLRKLKNENIVKETRIKELLIENTKLRKSFSPRKLYLRKSKSLKLRGEINDIRNHARTSKPTVISQAAGTQRGTSVPPPETNNDIRNLSAISSAPDIRRLSTDKDLSKSILPMSDIASVPPNFHLSFEGRTEHKCSVPFIKQDSSSNWSLFDGNAISQRISNLLL